MTSKFTVIYDACVLYPNYLRDILIQLAIADLFRAKWTNLIHDEWIRNLIENRPDLPKEKLNQVKDLMNSQVRDSLVTDFEQLIPSLALPDPNDRHILAAAIVAEADVIVTFNLKDFPDLNKHLAVCRYRNNSAMVEIIGKGLGVVSKKIFVRVESSDFGPIVNFHSNKASDLTLYKYKVQNDQGKIDSRDLLVG